MCEIDRRDFLMMGSVGTVALGASGGGAAASDHQADEAAIVHLHGDGLAMGPAAYAACLVQLAADGQVEPDFYSIGGSVEALEKEMAKRLGKERAVFFPTGTLANQVAVRILAGEGRRILVQKESHIYNDSGDCCQNLSGLHLIGLVPGESTFTVDQVVAEVERAEAGRVHAPVGVISIESPVRRLWGRVFDFDEIKLISSYAREHGIALHLDGARVFLAEPYTGVSPQQYAALFDTVYVSLWKYFNAASGAVLAGPAEFLDGLFHQRRMYGGSLPQAWLLAAVARHHLDGFSERFQAAVDLSEELYRRLEAHPAFTIERVPNGTNVAKLAVRSDDLEAFGERAQARGISLSEPLPDGSGFKIQVNETWTRLPLDELTRRLEEAAG